MSSERRRRAALIGFGEIGARHARILRSADSVEFVGIADICPPLATPSDVPVYDCVASLYGLEPDVIVVATPPLQHAPLALDAMSRGVDVIVEKPIATSVAEFSELLAAEASATAVLNAVHQYRVDPLLQELKASIGSGDLGELLFVDVAIHWRRDPPYFEGRSRWRAGSASDGAGPIFNQGIHGIDIASWLGGPVGSVSATTATVGGQHENLLHAAMHYTTGGAGSVQVTTGASVNLPIAVEVVGTRATATYDGAHLRIRGPGVDRSTRSDLVSRGAVHARFVHLALTRTSPVLSAHDIRSSMNLLFAITESASTSGSRIALGEVVEV